MTTDKIFFSLFKNNKEKDTQPDYRLSAKVGEKFESIGGGWIKENDKGKYISISVDKNKVLEMFGDKIVEKSENEDILSQIPF